MTHLIRTHSFKLAVYEKGDKGASKVAIVIPGRLDTKDYVHISKLVDFLANLGYYSIAFDPPGTWKSPGEISLYTSTNILLAIDELIEYYGKKPTILAGHSMGGTHAMISGCSNNFVTHLISIFSSHKPTMVDSPKVEDEAKISYRDLPPGSVHSSEKTQFDLPYSYFEDGRQYEALALLKKCMKPKLFLYGTKDELISREEIMRSYSFSTDPKEIIPIDAPHDYRLIPEAIEKVNNAVGLFLHKYP
jgi:predicted alpha/beta-hydrolase family hydrolase